MRERESDGGGMRGREGKEREQGESEGGRKGVREVRRHRTRSYSECVVKIWQVLVLERSIGQDFCTLWWCHAGEGCRDKHPSKTLDEGVRLYRTVLCLPQVDRKNLEDEAIWWMLVYLRVFGSAWNQFKGYGHCYQVLLPHILGEDLETVLGRNTDKHGNNVDWPFEPLIYKNDSLCCIACLRVLV